jgi:L-fuculose-phosphate aldolase
MSEWPNPDRRVARADDGSYFHVDSDGRPAYAQRYLAVSGFHEGYAVAHRSSGDAVLIEQGGHELPTGGTRFRWILPFQGGRALACTLEGDHGALDRAGRFHADAPSEEQRARQELTRVAHLIYERGYNVSIDGNLSYRLADGNLLMTPSGSHNGFLRPEELVITRPDGSLLRGDRRPTSEYRLHVELYRARPDIGCVVHVHSPFAVAASLAGVDLHKTYITIAPIPTTPYARISSPESPAVMRPYMQDYNWAILPRHGTVAWSDTIWNAFLRIEGLEHCAKVVMTARAAGPIEPLPNDKRIELLTFWGLERLGEDL